MILEIDPTSPPVVHVAAAAILYLHIGSGLAALAAGAAALLLRKGSPWHRRTGDVFVVSMLIMATIGAVVSPFLQPPQWVNVTAGAFTLYLVISGWLTMRRRERPGLPEIAMLAVAVAIASSAVATGIVARGAADATVRSDVAPAFVFASVVTLAAIGDLRLILRGALSGVQRLARHLWRMCYALFIAAGSLFLGQPQVFPEPIRSSGLLFVPVISILIVMIFWLVRVRRPALRALAAVPVRSPSRVANESEH